MTDDEVPTLSVVVLNHNYARYLPACLDSILEQSFTDFEVILVDDASTDASLAVIEPYRADPRVRLITHEANQGMVASLIEGTEAHTRGKYLTVISADDLALDQDAFRRQIGALEIEPGATLCFSAFEKFGALVPGSLRRLHEHDRTIPGSEFVRLLLTDREYSLLHSGTVIRASAYDQAGGYRPGLRNYVDLSMWLTLGLVGPAVYIDAPLYGYRIHGDQFSSDRAHRRATLVEGLSVLDDAAATAAARGIPVSRRAVRKARIADLALADAFAGRSRLALMRCWDILAEDATAALLSSGWWLAFARSVAGTRLWSLAALVRRSMG